MATITEILESHGPGLTTDIIDVLVKNGASSAAARKRIERAKGEYERFAGLRFAKNARFIYLEHQYGDKAFWQAMERAFEQAGTAYFHAVNSLRARGGRCRAEHFAIIASAPLARERHLSPDRILERLQQINFLEEVTLTNEQKYIQFKPNAYHKDSEALIGARLLAESVALNAVHSWARNIGLGSFGKFKLRDDAELPIVSGLAWDLSAPSYARPMRGVKDGKMRPGFFVCDVNLRDSVGIETVAAFIHKHDAASAPRHVAPILPILIADVYQQEAFDLARQKGVMATTIATLFGEDVRKALQDLIKLLSDAGNTASVNPEHMETVLSTLTKIEGSAANVRGTLFEFVAGALIKDVENGYLIIGQKETDMATGKKFEIDVLLDQKEKNRTLIVECKAKIPGSLVSKADVKRWYDNRVPLIYKTLTARKSYVSRQFVFELWSNGGLHPDASNWLEAQQRDFGGYKIGWRDGRGLKDYSNKASAAAIRKALNEHYFKHPLAKLKLSNQIAF